MNRQLSLFVISLLIICRVAYSIEIIFYANDTNIQLIGRSLKVAIPDTNKIEYRFDQPGFLIQTTVLGASEVTLMLRAYRDESAGEPNRFWIYVDGIKQDTIIDTNTFISGVLTECIIATGLSKNARHFIQVMKITEADWNELVPTPNYIHLAGLILDGGQLVKSEPLPNRRIEFVGDSVTAGFCNLCDDTASPIVPTKPTQSSKINKIAARFELPLESLDSTSDYARESYALAWPNVACNSLKSSCHTTAWSGYGLTRNCCGGSTFMPEVYCRTLASDPASVPWDFSHWIPQAVVINLGTNDHLDSSNEGPAEKEFIRTYVELLHNITTYYGPRVSFFLACGPMSDAYCPYVQSVIDQVTNRSLSNPIPLNAYFLEQRNILNETNQCCGHPNAQADVTMAEVTTKLISATLNWY